MKRSLTLMVSSTILAIASLSAATQILAQSYTFELLAENSFVVPSINEHGEIALFKSVGDTQQILTGTPGAMSVVAEAFGDTASDGQLNSFRISDSISFNDNGAFTVLAEKEGVGTVVVVNDQVAAQEDANIRQIRDNFTPLIANDGTVYYQVLADPLFDQLPGGHLATFKQQDGNIDLAFATEVFNQNAFTLRAASDNSVYGTRNLDGRSGIYAESSPNQLVIGESKPFTANSGHALPDGGELKGLRDFVVNDSGQFAFSGYTGDNSETYGIWAGEPDNLRTVLSISSNDSLTIPHSMNNDGDVVFVSTYGANGELILDQASQSGAILKAGDPLFGSTVQEFRLGRQSLNTNDEVVFGAYLADGRFVTAFATPGGQDFVWTNPDGGLFAEGGNWDQNAAPDDASHTAIFDLDSAYAVDLDATAQTGVTRVSQGDVTLNLNGHNYNVADTLIVGDTAEQSATLRIPEFEGLIANDIVVGEVDGADGLLILGPDSTAGSSLSTAASTQGGAGSGTGDDPPKIAENLTVKSGSQIQVTRGFTKVTNVSTNSLGDSDADPAIVIDGTNHAGVTGLLVETLRLQADAAREELLSTKAQLDAKIVLIRAGRMLMEEASKLNVESVGEIGMLIAQEANDEGELEARNSTITIGPQTSTVVGLRGTGTLTLKTSELNAGNGRLIVALENTGRFTIVDQSEATVGMIDVGREPGSMGIVSVMSDQGTSTLAADQVNVAVEGQGTLEVMDGGVADVTGEINVSDPGSGDVMPLFGAATNHGILAGGGDTDTDAGSASGAFTYGPGTLRVEGTGIVTADVINIGDNGQLTGTGTVQTANGLNINNLLKPGASPGILNIVGPVHLTSSGVVEIEIAGTTPGLEHDVLKIIGDSDFDGLFTFIFDGYSPQQGDTFDFLMVDGQADLTNVKYEVRNLLPGFEFEVSLTVEGFQMVALNNGTFVPEPGTLALASLCLFGVLNIRRVKLWRHPRLRNEIVDGNTCGTASDRTKWI